MGGFKISRFFPWAAAAPALALFLLSSCQGPGRSPEWTGPGPAAFSGPPPDLNALEEPGNPTNWKELERLGKEPPTFARRIRRAFLYLRVRRPDRAKEELDQALLTPGLSREQEAVAWYGKALAFTALELPGRARWSLEQARKATMDPSLLARLKDLESGIPPWSARSRRKSRPGPAAGPIRIHSRKEWGARPAAVNRTTPMGRIYRITIHHSGFPCPDSSPAAVEALIRTIQKNHKHKTTNGEGWADVGYHFLIDPAGRIWQGRSLRYQGAHAGNHRLNKGNIGICLLGNFQDHPPSPAQMKGLEKLLRFLMKKYRIPASRIYTHRELKSTACPGRYAQRAINQLRRKLSLPSS